MLTKRQLIEALEALDVPDDTPVVSCGFDETGFDYTCAPYTLMLKLDVDRGSHVGPHVEECDRVWRDNPDVESTLCVVVDAN